MTLAEAEDLPAHGAALKARLAEGELDEHRGWEGPAAVTNDSTTSRNAWDELPIRDELRGQSPYGAPQLDVPVRLNTNENPYPLPEALVERIAERVREAARDLNRYPDRDAVELRTELARYLTRTAGHEVTAAHVWAANGSNEVLQQLLQTFGGPGRTAIGFEPSRTPCTPDLPGHRTGLDLRAAQRRLHHRRRRRPHRHRRAPARGRLHHLAQQPHRHRRRGRHRPRPVRRRPGRRPLDRRRRRGVRRVQPPALAAPADRGPPQPGPLPDHVQGVRRGAGLRLGYLAADPAVVDAVQLVRLPYHLSSITQATALAALEHTDTLLGYVAQLKSERDPLAAELRATGYEVTASDANFVQFGRFDDSHAVWRRILDKGVLVRDNGVPGSAAVTAGTPEENDAFLDAVRELKKEHDA
ncbi:Histidinol-phosphate aminotransferase [Streptomyces californicus]